uniref:Small ribosomal subunit protein uS13 n=1 Tax=uncultured Chloroflexi bacterium Rifle_16ft_4_minimus_38099 TaxID=1665073 RepID=A0A0H4TRX3_9CHLR|nr:30S ribosomal protein S13P, small subunit ribosomal protein S13 [uncultured Chloroflexi bacterium Rifle_16ft_4_minimus_38099]
MARIEGIDLPRDKRIEVGLTYIYGLGPSTARKALAQTGVSPDTRVRDLTEDEITALRDYVGQKLTVEGDLVAAGGAAPRRSKPGRCFPTRRGADGCPSTRAAEPQTRRPRQGSWAEP